MEQKGINNHEKEIDVVAIGNAIVDVLVYESDSFLEKNSLTKGSMALIDEDEANKLYKSCGPGLETSGGSAANTMAGLSQLGGKAGFIGRVKKDQLGEIFTHDICSTGAIYTTPAIVKGPSTARCFIFVTPDAQRTMCTFLGASVFLNPADLDLSLVRKTKVLYLEGYLWDHDEAKNAFITSAKECKLAGGKVALSLSDSFCIDRHRESFQNLVENHVDILFANESEIISLYESNDFESAKNIIKGKCEVSVLTRGKDGSLILHRSKEYIVRPYKLGELLDTTGAGDIYAAGFLYGYTNNKDLYTCGKIGSFCAGHIVTQLGPRSRESLVKLLDEQLHLKDVNNPKEID
ncbi:adenosine kinase [Prochlorococcus marinus]|uniref:Possible carbohydrate kinase n=1 Tax=Prochlorococcus marinus (strain MIT 9211) TaxID=93059 RepID=A9BEC7_PROM4|nr:adenosine kinase [Prochlorococcus marinus]ABX08437.1 Possible carbohydrate kinase [Prochlorococcus marinus str. MIT 9211]